MWGEGGGVLSAKFAVQVGVVSIFSRGTIREQLSRHSFFGASAEPC